MHLQVGREEGWGAVLNESMNSCLAVVANKFIGASPFLIEDGKNGYLYESLEELCKRVEELIIDKNKRIELSKNAYETIAKTWNSEVATKNLIKMFENRLEGKDTPIEFGPASKAFPILEEI
jgi:glycosyltransferase involved in cell wall biosynthesis